MKKLAIPVLVIILVCLVSLVMADENGRGKEGKLFLFQKCDQSLIGDPYDSLGCPKIVPGAGPWPIFRQSEREGQLEYSLWGDKFEFSFKGRRLSPRTNYSLIYYPDPWPGSNLICLGSGYTNRAGNMKIHGAVETNTSLPASGDANFNPAPPPGSGAVGAKIWLVLSDDVKCTEGAQMLGWNPTAYLFEYNLIVFEHLTDTSNDDDDDHGHGKHH